MICLKLIFLEIKKMIKLSEKFGILETKGGKKIFNKFSLEVF